MTPGKAAVSTRAGRVALLGMRARALLVLLPLLLWPAAASAQLIVKRIPLKTNDLVYDPHSARVYASVPDGEANGNSVAVIDPATATVVTFIPVGLRPNRLAVSDDGQYLYVGVDGNGSIRVVDLPSLTVVQEFSLGMDGYFPRQATDMAVQPGHNRVLAVSASGLRVFEGGVPRAKTGYHEPEGIAFDPGGSLVYAGETGGQFVRYRVDLDGVTEVDRAFLADLYAVRMQLADGLLYSLGGDVFDPAFSQVVATLPTDPNLPVIVDAAASVAYYVRRENVDTPNADVLLLVDTRTFLPIGRYALSGVTFAYYQEHTGVSLGSGRLAFRDDTQVVFLTVPDTPFHPLRVNLVGSGGGQVSGTGSRIACGGASVTCSDVVPEGTVVELSAVAGDGSTFDGWSGDEDCRDGVVTMAASRWCTASFSSATSLLTIRRLPLGGNDLAFNPATGRLLVSSGSEPGVGNSLVEVDPVSGEIARATWVGANLGRLALADDGRTLYIGHTPSSAVFHVDLETAASQRYDLGRWYHSPRRALDLAVQPGHPEVVAVADNRQSVVVLDRGVPRPVTAHAGGDSNVAFGGTPDVLYAYELGDSKALRQITVGATGATVSGASVVPVSFGGDLYYVNGLLHTDNGYVIDSAGNAIRKFLVDEFATDEKHAAFDPAANRAYFLARCTQTRYLWAFDLSTGDVLWRTSFQAPEDYFNYDRRLVSLGNDRLALLTFEGLYLIDAHAASPLRMLRLQTTGRGTGSVSSAGLTCRSTDPCTALLPEGTPVALSVSADSGSFFSGWEGDADCSDSVVTMTTGHTCRARFLTPRTAGDVDGDHDADLILWNSRLGVWTVTYSSFGSSYLSACASCAGNVAVPGDYDGDGRMDKATWQGSTGIWYIERPSSRIQWGRGSAGDIPLPGDYDGDGLTDLAVWRPGNGTWYVLLSSQAYATTTSLKIQWGANGDKPVPGDYDGDGRTDLAVWRPATGYWKILLSSKGYAPANALSVQWGSAGARDVLVPGDFDGDAKSDLAVWRPGNGTWYVLRSSLGFAPSSRSTVQFGASTDVPSPVDYDADGKLEPVVWRASTGTWLILRNSSDYATKTTVRPTTRGGAGDTPAHDYR